jgi:hypothetical protein
VPGTYTFTLRAFDDIHESTKDVTLQVSKGSGISDTAMTVTPPSWNAGSLAAGLADTASFTIANKSSAGVTISGDVVNPTDPVFSILSGMGPFTLGEGGTAVFRVKYSSDGKSHNANLTVTGPRAQDKVILTLSSSVENGGSDVQTAIHGTKDDFIFYPNPVLAYSTLRYNLSLSGTISITIIDPLGRVVETPVDGEFQEAGQHEIPIDARGLAAGIYLCRLSGASVEQETKFVVER